MPDCKENKTVMKMTAIKGLTLIEMMIVLAIFSVVMAGLYSAYTVLSRQGIQEFKLAETGMELQIGKSVISRDLSLTGYGVSISDGLKSFCGGVEPTLDASGQCLSKRRCNTLDPSPSGFCVPIAVGATDGVNAPDTLTLMGTAIARGTVAALEWSFVGTETPQTVGAWSDPREALKQDHRMVYVNPIEWRVLTKGTQWVFSYESDTNSANKGTTDPPSPVGGGELVYGLYHPPSAGETEASFPYYVVRYGLGGAPPSLCAPGTLNLERGESRNNYIPTGEKEVIPVYNCVLDFQVAIGLDNAMDKVERIDCWDNGGKITAGFNHEALYKRLKMIRVYVLVQQGGKDPNYLHEPATIRVGDLGLTSCEGGGVGRDVTLTAEQRMYKWKVVSASIWPRNIPGGIY